MNFANVAIASWLVIATVPAVATAQTRDPLDGFDAYVTLGGNTGEVHSLIK